MSILLDNIVDELSRLPAVGEKTALRLALHILQQPKEEATALANSITDFRNNIKNCSQCNNLSDEEICPICMDKSRDTSTICVVERVKDVMSIESIGEYKGLYHVLGGVISPMMGIGPSSLKIDLLLDNIKRHNVKEVIVALSTSLEGETTLFYIKKRLADSGVKISNIARGIGFGDELDYADEMTLIHAIRNRTSL
ncbi:MAG: recombination mediator RecR [Rikenellaceae bacterium]